MYAYGDIFLISALKCLERSKIDYDVWIKQFEIVLSLAHQ